MGMRALLVALVIAATAAFVVGVSIERGDEVLLRAVRAAPRTQR